MEGIYEVFYHDQSVGKVQVLRQGLYYRFCCRAQVADNRVCRLVAQWNQGWENLGILVPEGSGYALDRKMPAKRMGETPPIFRLIPSGEDIEKALYPAAPEEKTEAKLLQVQEPVEEETALEIQEPEQIGKNRKVPAKIDQENLEAEEELPEEQEEAPGEEIPEAEEPMQFYPIQPEAPFQRLEDLEKAVYAFREEQPGLLMPEEEELPEE